MRYNIPQIQSRLNEFAVLQAGKLKPAQKFNPPLLPLCHPHAHSVTLSHTQMHTHAHTHTLERQAPGGICFFFFFFTAREWSCWSEVTFTYEHRRDLRPPPWETFDSEALVREQDGSGLSSSCGLSLHCITLTRISHAFTCTNELLCVVLLIKGMYFGLTDLTDARFLYLYLILSLKLWL